MSCVRRERCEMERMLVFLWARRYLAIASFIYYCII